MSLQSNEVTSPPAATAANTEEKKGAGNTSFSDFARKIAAAQVAPTPFTAKAEPPAAVKTEATAPVTEEATEVTSAEVTTEEPKEEAQAETVETKEETEEVLSPETNSSLDPKLQAILDKKISKEVSKRYKLKAEFEGKLAALEARLSQQPEVQEKEIPVPVPANVPLAEITSLEALNQYKENLANDIVEAEMLLHSDFPAEGKQTKWGLMTKDALISALTQAKKDERTAIPAREKFLTAKTQAQQTAFEQFPFLKDPTHPGYAMAKSALRDNPVLAMYPNSQYLVGLLVKGQLAVQEEAKAKTEAKTPPKLKPKPTAGQAEISSDASAARTPTALLGQQALTIERNKVAGGKKSLGHKDFAQLLLANQRFRNSQ